MDMQEKVVKSVSSSEAVLSITNTDLSTRSVVWFSEVGAGDVDIAGGKGANLGELAQSGAPVPPGFVVTTYAHQLFRKSLPEDLVLQMRELNDIPRENEAEILKRSDVIRQAIEKQEIPQVLRIAITSYYEQLSPADKESAEVAVRSAAKPEDSSDASFAGQQGTFLSIRGIENVLHAYVACLATCYEGRSVIYRMELRSKVLEEIAVIVDPQRKMRLQSFAESLRHENFEMAVVIQAMVDSYVAGVMLMVDAATSNPDFITIDAAFGLGEIVVSGEELTDTFKFNKEDLSLAEKSIHSPQNTLIQRNPESSGSLNDATIVREAPAYLVNAPKLTQKQARALAEIGKKIEAHYGNPQDIEWAAIETREGWLEFFIVQTRPITVEETVLSSEPAPIETEHVLLGTGQSASPGVGYGTLRIVLGDPGKDPTLLDQITEKDILVAEMTTPDWVPLMRRARAIVTLKGGKTCHAAIVSREKGIPCIVGFPGALELPDGEIATVNAATGDVWLGKAEATIAWWQRQIEYKRKAVANVDTVVTHVCINQADPVDAAHNKAEGKRAAGNTLARAEFVWLELDEHPLSILEEGRRDEAVAALADTFSLLGEIYFPKTVTIRFNDLKPHELAGLGKGRGEKYEKPNMSENPQDGFRGVARYLKEPEVLRMEVDGILEARRRGYINLQGMLPYVRTPEELKQVIDLLSSMGYRRGEEGLRLIMMTELPVNALELDAFIDVGIDGVSVGSNDLTAKAFGLDRDWEGSGNYSGLEVRPTMLELYRMIGQTAYRRGLSYIGFCGQGVAFFPELAQRLVEWHYTHIGTSPDAFEEAVMNVANAEKKLGIHGNSVH